MLTAEITKTFRPEGFRLDVKFEAGNEVLSILGASGCGKSVTLQSIAGIIKPDIGRIILDGTTLFDSLRRINVSPQERHCGLMFQNYALFPNMTAEQNLMTVLRTMPEQKLSKKAEAIMNAFGLSEVRGLYPSQLSGGQMQRTALARMLLAEPGIIMLDEPFSSLDRQLRRSTERYMREIFRNFAGTVILVSHDIDEVFRLSDKIAVMNNGRIETYGTKHEVFSSPETRTAAILTGCGNISRAERVSANKVFASDWGITLRLSLNDNAGFIGIRSRDIRPCFDDDRANVFRCRVSDVIENTDSFTVMLCPEGSCLPLGMELSKREWAAIRFDIVNICLPEENILQLKE